MKKILVAIVLTYSSFGFSHGGDKPGPHGGFIEMPGAFHTEVVPEKDGSFKIYLIDINFQNPTVKESSVDSWIITSSGNSQLKCTSQQDHFECVGADKIKGAKQLVVTAKRQNAQGNEAKYSLPLKWHK